MSIDAPVEQVWDYIADFGGLDAWMPGVDSCTLDGDVRTLQVLGMEITEKLVSKDDDAHVLEYRIEKSPLNAESHLGRITVTRDADGTTATWFVEVAPDSLTDMLIGTYRQALEALKKQAEGSSA